MLHSVTPLDHFVQPAANYKVLAVIMIHAVLCSSGLPILDNSLE